MEVTALYQGSDNGWPLVIEAAQCAGANTGFGRLSVQAALQVANRLEPHIGLEMQLSY
jgi:hypothetical protein